MYSSCIPLSGVLSIIIVNLRLEMTAESIQKEIASIHYAFLQLLCTSGMAGLHCCVEMIA